MRKHFLFTILVSLLATAAFAAVGSQSIRVTFNGDNAEGWVASSGGSITSVADGVANVQMAAQSGTPTKYRADFQYNTTGFTMNKSKDVVWAIKLTTALPGTTNSRKFEIQYNDGSDKWINGINGPSGAFDCEDGGKIYYFNLGADGLNKLSALPEGEIAVMQIHFIMADATELTDETAIYAVDWVASFETVNDLKSFANWDDDKELGAEAYFELLFRPMADGTGYDSSTPKTGFEAANGEFEGNYLAGLFAVEYFLIENFSAEKYYSLVLTCTGNNSALSVWNFPYQVNKFEAASDIITKATAVVGIAPRATTGDINEPIASANIAGGTWTFIVPGNKLTVLDTHGNKSLVALLVSSKEAKIADQKGKFASCAHTSKAHPSLAIVPICNATQGQMENSLAEAVTNANANDVIVLSDDAIISGSRLEINKALTIQGATGEEKIICDVPANTQMVLANDNTDNYTVNFKNLIVDGKNTERSMQTFDSNNKGQFCFEDVSIINTNYSVVTGDVKPNNREVVLKGNNTFKTGIYLNTSRRVKHDGATHTRPIRLILASDYVENYAIVLTCDDPSKYEAIDAADLTGWVLYHAISGNKHEIKGEKVVHYTLNVSPVAKMATMVIGFNAELPYGVKAYQLEYATSGEYEGSICAYDESTIQANKPVLIIAEPDSYVFKGERGVAVAIEESNSSYGSLHGRYESESLAVSATDGAGNYNYVLANPNGGNGVGFYQIASGGSVAIRAHQAYLSCGYNQEGGGAAPKRMTINFNVPKTPTAIENVATAHQAEKLLIDGVIYIRKADHLYRIDGQLVK